MLCYTAALTQFLFMADVPISICKCVLCRMLSREHDVSQEHKQSSGVTLVFTPQTKHGQRTAETKHAAEPGWTVTVTDADWCFKQALCCCSTTTVDFMSLTYFSGLPVLIVGLTLVISRGKYKSHDHCWLSVQTDTIWAFVGPVIFVLTVCIYIVSCSSVHCRYASVTCTVHAWIKSFLTLFMSAPDLYFIPDKNVEYLFTTRWMQNDISAVQLQQRQWQ